MKHSTLLLLASVTTAVAGGCQSMPNLGMGWFRDREKSTYRTAEMRIDAIRDFSAKSNGTDTPEQQEITNQLARQIQVEPDPLVREAIVETISNFRTPLAAQVLEAGLQDADAQIRRKCCAAMGRRRDLTAVPVLANTIRQETDVDVRLAAVEALGAINSPDAIPALALALEDRDPAMQFAGVQSMKAISGRDFGGDVSQWLQYAKGETPTAPTDDAEISVASRLRKFSPF